MTRPCLLSIAAFFLSATLAHAAGFAFIEVPADREGPALRGAVWSPCDAPAGRIALDPLVIDGLKDCPVMGTGLPLVVVSHGTGGSFLGHHDTAATLADAGFVVAAISHPGDNFRDLSRQGHLSAFATRPVDMKRLVDHMLGRWPGRARLDPSRVGIFGFSRGGYTALAAVGAQPDWALRQDLCPPESPRPLCEEIRRRAFPAPPVPDPRIKAAVVADPLSVFDARGLKQVGVPVQLWASEYGGDGVTPASVDTVRQGLPAPPEWHVASGAAHFAFLAPCSPAMATTLPGLCRDGAGFDRVAFHATFNAEVLAFFQRHLLRAIGPAH
ncbi:alpha/beta hydrolase family protein [Paracidovorax anthurii]|uniref:Putative dienelactone hydrolase n=1 Tax=Paracidovorax anthurii TaxID=78229 RepID=A0A328ZGA5_9BURK|nr:alpha/beta hydrolase [Paracidovorax anthurii]RAR85248.1 putative dienelactone hydrolase [Paracidovorax anthurii]